MNQMSSTLDLTIVAEIPRNILRIYARETKYEFLKLLRLPIYSLSTIGFPLMFYILFAMVLGNAGASGPGGSKYLLATLGTFGIIGASLFGFGIGMATERGQGWLELKRASPMPPMAYFTAKLFVSILFGVILVLLLFALGFFGGGVRLQLPEALKLGAVLVSGAIPFSAMGLAMGYFLGPNSAPAMVNLIYLPMCFLSGLWIPIDFMPAAMQTIAHAMPPYHLVQIALKIIGLDSGGSVWTHIIFLVIFTGSCLSLARLGFRIDEGKNYG